MTRPKTLILVGGQRMVIEKSLGRIVRARVDALLRRGRRSARGLQAVVTTVTPSAGSRGARVRYVPVRAVKAKVSFRVSRSGSGLLRASQVSFSDLAAYDSPRQFYLHGWLPLDLASNAGRMTDDVFRRRGLCWTPTSERWLEVVCSFTPLER